MTLRKIVIADPSEEICAALEEALLPGFQVSCCGSGTDALALVRTLQPDLLILELQLPRLDGIAVLRQLASLPHRPQVLVYTMLDNAFVGSALQNLYVAYAMCKPSPARLVAERVREILAPPAVKFHSRETADILCRLSIPDTSQGYRNILVGIPLLALQPDRQLTKDIYLQIAADNHVTPRSVEKSIRDAIRAGWDRGNPGIWQEYFPGMTCCPSNKQFLFRIAGHLRWARKCG